MPRVKKVIIHSTSSGRANTKPKAKTAKPVVKVQKRQVKELPKQTGLKLSVYSASGRILESISLPKEIFGLSENKSLLAQAVRVYLANQRSGTAKSKSRGEVNISTRKIYRQKGTGRARHGAASAPIFVGGGVAFGPRPHDFSLKMSKNARRTALFTALSSKLTEGVIKVVAGLEKLEPKTKNVAGMLAKLETNGKKRNVLLITPNNSEKYKNVVKAARNIDGVQILSSNLLNTYEVLRAKELFFMKEAINSLKESKN